ncbi:hypothetical protein ACLOJK_014445 [Asimina triloba]
MGPRRIQYLQCYGYSMAAGSRLDFENKIRASKAKGALLTAGRDDQDTLAPTPSTLVLVE